jgi:hypothetical protein
MAVPFVCFYGNLCSAEKLPLLDHDEPQQSGMHEHVSSHTLPHFQPGTVCGTVVVVQYTVCTYSSSRNADHGLHILYCKLCWSRLQM